MGKYSFMYEMSNKEKVKVFFISASILLSLAVAFFVFYLTLGDVAKNSSFFISLKNVVVGEIKGFTPLGLFYAGFLGELFFIPIPPEPMFYYGLIKGNSIWLSLFFISTGYVLSQVLNYYMGYKMSRYILYFISTKKIYEAKRKMNKYGAYGIFLMNLIPSPAPFLHFALGIAKYNIWRMLTFVILGDLIKYGAIAAFYAFFT